jgi:uncharacterized repeat protein (TIGR01451 family)
MKKLLLSLLAFTALTSSGNAQQNNVCENALSLCGSLGVPFSNTINSTEAPLTSAATYGCLATRPNPAWFYMPVSTGGNLSFSITQTSANGNPVDVDFISWGPFSNSDVCGPANLNAANQVGCSYSTAAMENFSIPNTQSGQYYILMVTNFSNQAGTIVINQTNAGQPGSGTLNCSGLRLHAFLDANTNGSFDTGEVPFPAGNFIYEKNNDGVVHNISNMTGYQSIFDENLSNTYNVGLNIPANMQSYVSVAPAAYNNVSVNTATNIVTHRFPVTVTQPFEDLAVYTIAPTQPLSGFTYKNHIIYVNKGVVPASGTVTFTKDPALTIATISEAGAVSTPTGFTYDFVNLQPFEIKIITVIMNVPPIPGVALGQAINTSSTITGAVVDIDLTNNESAIDEEVVGSYDPNDKMEAHGGRIKFDEFAVNDYLYYTIRFQNTGTAPAVNVRIEDILDSQLDASSFEMIRASHNFTVDRVGNHITWRFNQIMLPHESANEPASHGYVYFRIKPTPGFAVNDVIPNAAGIYFDFNPVIWTNTFDTEFFMPLSNPQFDLGNFTMYPNPARQSVTITAPTGRQNLNQLRLIDITGKTLLVKDNLSTASATIDISSFGSGMYFMEITADSGTKATKKLVIE